jgi:hypothetical protein
MTVLLISLFFFSDPLPQRCLGGFVLRRSTRKRIEQILEGARHTEQKITWRELSEARARMWPTPVLFGAAVASTLLFIFFISAPPIGAVLGFLLVMVPFFFYLAILKLRLESCYTHIGRR